MLPFDMGVFDESGRDAGLLFEILGIAQTCLLATDKTQDGAAVLAARLVVRTDAESTVLPTFVDWALTRLQRTGKNSNPKVYCYLLRANVLLAFFLFLCLLLILYFFLVSVFFFLFHLYRRFCPFVTVSWTYYIVLLLDVWVCAVGNRSGHCQGCH